MSSVDELVQKWTKIAYTVSCIKLDVVYIYAIYDDAKAEEIVKSAE